ncbi:iron(iii) dicitrate transport atp-binding protein fece [Psychromonas sp. CNPT3]|uniref:ABC transporter ATP-binding protein n=1 Tax=Psychromonas sp. CNPT3 TaxID=314282 RepID=UPI00006E76CC|nr:ABC transporter ATP-binding protein [Psychromonas sp. CNPT3]AGH81638.1 iron(iii) dicitrate transport atp-binding protein fece [Psychromonas sp. CNPT3]
MTLQIKNVSFAHKNQSNILDDISLTFERGTFYVILGQNGCGKSTLFNLLMRNLPLTQGSITINGTDLPKFSHQQQAQTISVLSQSMTLPEYMTVAEMVMQGRFCYQSFLSRYSATDQKIVSHAMQQMQITDLADRKLSEISGGQQQRARMAMLLAQQTDIVLLDEPTSHLDLKHQYLLLDIAKDLTRQGKIVIAILHDMTQAALYGDEVIVLSQQQVYAQGSAQAVITSKMVEDVFEVSTTRIGNDKVGVHVPTHLFA